jgi:hypothetical protein
MSDAQVAQVLAALTPEQVAREYISWSTEASKMNRKLVRLLDLCDEAEAAGRTLDPSEVRALI